MRFKYLEADLPQEGFGNLHRPVHVASRRFLDSIRDLR